MAIEFSERQRTTIAAAITILSAVVILLASGVVLDRRSVLREVLRRLSALAVAMVAALGRQALLRGDFDPPQARTGSGTDDGLSSFIIPVAGLGWFFGDILVDQTKGLVEAFQPGGRQP